MSTIFASRADAYHPAHFAYTFVLVPSVPENPAALLPTAFAFPPLVPQKVERTVGVYELDGADLNMALWCDGWLSTF